MSEVSTIGLDSAKSVFQIHGIDSEGAVLIRKGLSRAKVLGSLQLCRRASSALRRAQPLILAPCLQALGHTVRLMPPSYVKAYVKRSKNDANDAAAICEAVSRPSMRFVPTKSE
jgi:transposase